MYTTNEIIKKLHCTVYKQVYLHVHLSYTNDRPNLVIDIGENILVRVNRYTLYFIIEKGHEHHNMSDL